MLSIQPTHLAQVAVAVRDVDRAKSFYRDKLGLRHLFDAPPGLSFFQCGQTRLRLSEPEGPNSSANSILYYAVPDARTAQSELIRRGVTFEQDAHCVARVDDCDIWLAIFRDSEGNLLGLMSEEAAS